VVCINCKQQLVLNAISYGKCIICGKDIVCPYIPCYALCDECSKETHRCQQCGKRKYVKKKRLLEGMYKNSREFTKEEAEEYNRKLIKLFSGTGRNIDEYYKKGTK
jgi:hypothetical protein